MDRSLTEECVSYFRNNPVLASVLEQLKEKYASYGSAAGKAAIQNPSPKDVEVLEGLMQKNFHGQKKINISASSLEKALQKTKYAGITVEELMQEYFGELTVKKEVLRKAEEKRKKLLKEAKNENLNFPAYDLLSDMEEGNSLYQFWKNHGEKESDLRLYAETLNHLPCLRDQILYLPVFAAEVTGDPHAFDIGKHGELLNHIVDWYLDRKKEETVVPVTEKKEKYYACGILLDDMSNNVMISGVRGYKDNGEEHAGLKGFAEDQDPVNLPLSVLSKLSAVSCPDHEIHIVENPAVYAVLADRVKTKAFMCTYGQLKLASVVMLDLLVKSGIAVFYAGDFDPEGIGIAMKIKEYVTSKGGAFHYWHMTPEDYLQCMSEKELSDQRIRKMERLNDEELSDTVKAVMKNRKAGYQESLMEDYLKDLQ